MVANQPFQILAIILAWLVSIPLFAMTAARAEVATRADFDIDRVYGAVEQLIIERQKENKLPLLSDARDGATLAAFFDTKAFLRGAPYTQASVPQLMTMLEKQNAVLKTYLKSYLDAIGDGSKSEQPQKDAAKSYDAEMAHGLSSMIKIIAAIMPAMTHFVGKLPPEQLTDVRKDGLSKMRSGLLDTIRGAAMSFQETGYSAAYQDMIAASLAEAGAPIASGMLPDQRATMRDFVASVLPQAAEPAKPHLQSFITAMETVDCTGLCAVK